MKAFLPILKSTDVCLYYFFSTSNGIMLHNMNLFYHNVCCGNGTGSFELHIVLWNQRLPPPRAEANYGAVRHRGICCTFPIMPRMPLNFLPADGSLGERWEGGQREGRWGGQKKLGPSLAILGCFPLSFLCLYHYLKDSHHVFHLYRSAQLRALSVGTKAESPTIPAYVSTKSKPAVTALIIVISSS